VLARLRPRITYANVVATLALFLAIGGGTAFALVAANQVNSESIIDGEVKNPDIAADSVGTGKLFDGSVLRPDIGDNAVGSGELVNDSATGDDIAAGAIGSAELATFAVDTVDLRPSAVTGSKIATDAVRADEIDAGAVGSSEIAADAVGGSELAGGSVRAAEHGRLPGVRVDRSSNQAIADGGEVNLNWTRDVYDPDGMHSTSEDLSTIRIPVAGRYLITGTGVVTEDSALHQLHILELTKNNVVQAGEDSQDRSERHSISTIVAAAEGDAIRMKMFCLHHCTIGQQNMAVQWLGP
jgi:hypothetical protein